MKSINGMYPLTLTYPFGLGGSGFVFLWLFLDNKLGHWMFENNEFEEIANT